MMPWPLWIPIGLAVYTPIVLGAARLCGLNSRPVEQQEIAPHRSLTPGESMRQHCEDEGATTGAGLRTKRPRRSLSLDDEDLAIAAAERWADERGGWKQ